MSRTQYEITVNWVDNVVRDDPQYLTNSNYSLYPKGNTLVSRFAGEMARLVKGRLFLLNGDAMTRGGFGHSDTLGVQENLRTLTRATKIPAFTIPYSALESAGIDLDSVRVIEEQGEWYEPVEHSAATLDEVPQGYRSRMGYVAGSDGIPHYQEVFLLPGDDGLYHWTTQEHHLGASVFRARYSYTDREHMRNGFRDYPVVKGSAVFVTGFDMNELQEVTLPSGRRSYGRQLWFMAQLPRGSKPKTVAEAMEMLKPAEVKLAEEAGIEVLRQGDVFAYRSELTGKELAEMGAVPVQPARNGGRYVNDSHTATKVLKLPDGQFYVQGILRHRPAGRERGRWDWQDRRPEHRNLHLGDGKAWYAVAFNTVPRSFSPRAWALGGRVD